METASSEILEQAIELLGNPDMSQEQMADILLAHGVDDMLASRLATFLPEAFGAILASHMEQKVGFPSTFLTRDKAGKSDSIPFAAESVFVRPFTELKQCTIPARETSL